MGQMEMEKWARKAGPHRERENRQKEDRQKAMKGKRHVVETDEQ